MTCDPCVFDLRFKKYLGQGVTIEAAHGLLIGVVSSQLIQSRIDVFEISRIFHEFFEILLRCLSGNAQRRRSQPAFIIIMIMKLVSVKLKP
jgi:hypothetical protein